MCEAGAAVGEAPCRHQVCLDAGFSSGAEFGVWTPATASPAPSAPGPADRGELSPVPGWGGG